jgi:hypothetical protein
MRLRVEIHGRQAHGAARHQSGTISKDTWRGCQWQNWGAPRLPLFWFSQARPGFGDCVRWVTHTVKSIVSSGTVARRPRKFLASERFRLQIQPLSLAILAAWARLRAPSFVMAEDT